jgi:hypothetical protein
MSTCPNEYLCWFFHVPWGQELNTGRTFWNELCFRYYDGLNYVNTMKSTQWPSLSSYIDTQRFNDVKKKLDTHYNDALTWRDVCTRYFATFSKMPIPAYDPKEIIKIRPATLGTNPQPIYVFNLQGKLVATFTPGFGDHLNDHKRTIAKKLHSGIYLMRQKGVKPLKIMIDTRDRY